MTPRTIVVNGAFRPQRITGQQRYATEIADRLGTLDGFGEHAPAGRWAGSAAREWAWTLLRLPRSARGSVLLSLTARAPFARRQVLVVHDLFVLTNPEWYSRRYILTHAPALRAQLRAARAVIAVSEPTAQAVRERFSGTIVIAPNAPSTVFADRTHGSAAPASHGLAHGEYLLAVGSMDPRKNLPTLADAYSSLPEAARRRCPLVVVGGSASIYRDQQIDWPQETVFTGYVSDDDLRALYAGARAVVFPSLAEGFGLPLVEAAAAGAPALVVSDIPVFRWICGDGAVYVDPTVPESVADGLRAAIRGDIPPLTIDLTRFDWDASARTVAEVCSEVAGR
ncbi:glycosyltransferase family 1 protein [Demequina capsici]|uniref:Glycosyltransferase family 1 protein n=1 Tax=Demequina capsici TaxID=3075620 RepID=A0AA96FEA9_9MICO|nr:MULTISPECIES: glycosyltransferase family 1 protein [unclassified Demequina]WNM25512.1 glycosyltransferase family 1 protein [Demequina sp. OYTSA14]WNM28403.1 glycosyltransferase family 1 protein [Demequina sp. PMTSA13]